MYLVGLGLHKHRVHVGGKISRVKKAASTEIISIMKKKQQRNKLKKQQRNKKTADKKAEKSEISHIKERKRHVRV